MSFLKENWDQCCFERGDGTAGTKQHCRDAGCGVLTAPYQMGWVQVFQSRTESCTLSGEIQYLGRVRYSSLAGQGAADSHVQNVNVDQWKRKCPERPENIACSLLTLTLSVFPPLGERWKVLVAATDVA